MGSIREMIYRDLTQSRDLINAIRWIKEDLLNALILENELTDNKIINILDKIILCSHYGSSQNKINYIDGFIFQENISYSYNDIDIAVIFDIDIKQYKIPSNIKIKNGDIFLDDRSGYSYKKLGNKYLHYFLLSKKEYDDGIKNNIDYCLAIKNGKKLYIKE